MVTRVKTDEIMELEVAAMTVLSANPTTAAYDDFRRLFAGHLTNVYCYSAFRVERALVDLDRGEVELPSHLPFSLS